MTERERKRYFRQLLLSDFGEACQQKLKASSLLVAGAGGLGSPVSVYLAAAGVGRLVICDNDRVELSNLNRQVLHNTRDIGNPKTDSAQRMLSDLNPEISIETHHVTVDLNSLNSIPGRIDMVADCLDNIHTRMELNAFSIQHRIPLMHGGIDGWTGQVTLIHPPSTPCMHCLFGEMKDTSEPKPVLGAVAGIIGTFQALEIIKYLAGIGNEMGGQLHYFDGENMEWTKLDISKDSDCPVCSSL